VTRLEALARLPVEESNLAVARAERKVVAALIPRYEKQFTALGPRPADHALADNLRATVPQLKGDGIRERDGLVFAELLPRVRKPGLARLDVRIRQAEAEITRLRDYLARWPSDATTHAFRYTGRHGRHEHNWRYLEPGDVVELNESRASAWADRSEPVTEGDATVVT